MTHNTAKGRPRPPIEPISTGRGLCNDVSQRLIPVRGELSPSSALPYGLPPLHIVGPGITPTNTNTKTNTTLPPLSAPLSPRPDFSPDIYVLPSELPRHHWPVFHSSSRPRRHSSLPDGETMSPLPDDGPFTVRAVVHSDDRHYGITRRFDANTLHTPVADGASPRSPTLDTHLARALLDCRTTPPPPDSPLYTGGFHNLDSMISPMVGSPSVPKREAELGYQAEPVGKCSIAQCNTPS
jgi:hypothetical protein